jgi:hypothetical protein
MLKAFLAALVAAFSLAACASLDDKVGSVTASDNFRRICASEPLIHSAFVALAVQTQRVPASVIRAEADAHEIVATICANPPANTSQALAAAASAYANVLKARARIEQARAG